MCDVLVLDDHELVRAVLVEMLEDEGLKVRSAATPSEALSITQEPAGCSVLVTDIDLGSPDIDGFKLAARVRSYAPGTPIVFVTGRPEHFAGRTSAADERSLIKPFRGEEFVRAVRVLLPNGPMPK